MAATEGTLHEFVTLKVQIFLNEKVPIFLSNLLGETTNFLYLSIWIDNKSIAWDSSLITSDYLALGLTRFLLNKRIQGF